MEELNTLASMGITHYYLTNSMREFSRRSDHVSLLVDIGCGHNPYLTMFKADDIVSVDIERRGDVDILCDVQVLPIKDSMVDMVLLTEVLEHVEDEKKALTEIYRILRPDGWFIISTPFIFGVHEVDDYRRLTAQGLKKLLGECNFDIIDFRYRGGCFSCLLSRWKHIPRELLGGDFKSVVAKLLYPLIGLHLILCKVLIPFAVVFDKLDKRKLSTLGYEVLCRKADQIKNVK